MKVNFETEKPELRLIELSSEVDKNEVAKFQFISHFVFEPELITIKRCLSKQVILI